MSQLLCRFGDVVATCGFRCERVYPDLFMRTPMNSFSSLAFCVPGIIMLWCLHNPALHTQPQSHPAKDATAAAGPKGPRAVFVGPPATNHLRRYPTFLSSAAVLMVYVSQCTS